MLKKVSNEMIQFMNGRVVIAAAILLGLFMILAFPQQSARMEAAAKGGGSPDTSFLYTPEDLYCMAETHGADGRQLYVRTAFTFDLAFPLIYTFSLAGMVSWVCGRLFPAGSRLRLANLVPLAGMFLDLLENSCVSLVMLRYPVHTPGVDVLAPLFTLLKWLFTGGSFLMILCGVVFVFVSRLKKR